MSPSSTSHDGDEISKALPVAPTTAQAGHTVDAPVRRKSEGATASADENGAPPKRYKLKKFLSLLALFASLFVAALNATIMATAIPTICRDLSSAAGYSWIGGAYLLGNAAAAPIWAKLSDIWGRKPILLSAVAGYFTVSIFCANAKTMEWLIAGRALQGVAGGGTVCLVNIVISDLFSMRHRGLYMGLLEICWAVAGGVGPVLGGTFASKLTWRWNFWIVLPFCGLAFVLLLYSLNVHNPRTGFRAGAKAIDWAGSVSMLAILIMILLGLNFGGVVRPWDSPLVICLIVFGFSMIGVFVFSEKKIAAYPLIPLELFSNRSNVAALVVGFVHDFCLFAGEYYLPLFFQSARILSPIHSGLLILPLCLSEALSGLVAGIFIHRTGRYIELIWVGLPLMMVGGALYITLDAHTSGAKVIGYQMLSGVGMGCLFTPPLLALQASVAQRDVATATSTLNLVRNIATVLAVVTGQVVFQNRMANQQDALKRAGLPEEILRKFGAKDAVANIDAIAEIENSAMRMEVQLAFSRSMRDVWIVCAVLIGVGLIASPLIKSKELSKEHEETKTGLEKEKRKPEVEAES